MTRPAVPESPLRVMAVPGVPEKACFPPGTENADGGGSTISAYSCLICTRRRAAHRVIAARPIRQAAN